MSKESMEAKRRPSFLLLAAISLSFLDLFCFCGLLFFRNREVLAVFRVRDRSAIAIHDQAFGWADSNAAAALNADKRVYLPCSFNLIHRNAIAWTCLLAHTAQNALLHFVDDMPFLTWIRLLFVKWVHQGLGLLEKSPERHSS